jgi:hypothetical protein
MITASSVLLDLEFLLKLMNKVKSEEWYDIFPELLRHNGKCIQCEKDIHRGHTFCSSKCGDDFYVQNGHRLVELITQ